MAHLFNRNVLLGVSGGIAAYKSAELIRQLQERGANVRVIMTRGAQEFITELTLQALSGKPVHLMVEGLSGANGFGFYCTAGVTIATINVDNPGAGSQGCAVAEFSIAESAVNCRIQMPTAAATVMDDVDIVFDADDPQSMMSLVAAFDYSTDAGTSWLQREAMLLKDEVERTTGKPLQWTPEERRLLSEKATGIDPDTLKQISIIDPADLAERNHQTDSTENR